MEKLRESLLAKLVAGVLLSIFVFLTLATALMAVGVYYECGYIPTSKAEAEEKLVEYIADNYYGSQIDNYYRAVLDGDEYTRLKMENQFSQENSNLSFTVTGLDSDGNVDDSMPVLSNYEMSDSGYHNVEISTVEYGYAEQELRIWLSMDTILSYIAQENKVDIVVEDNDGLRVYTYSDGSENADADNDGNSTVETVSSDDSAASDTTESSVTYVYDGDAGMYVVEYGDAESEEYPDWTIYDSYKDSDIVVFGDGDYRANGRDSVIYQGMPNIYVTDELDSLGVYLSDLPYTYFFEDDSRVQKKLQKTYNEICDDSDNCSYETYYDEDKEEIAVCFFTNKAAIVSIDMNVAKNLTAKDNFYSSWQLQLVDIFYSTGIPLFIVSLIMSVVLTIFLAVAAGHRKGEEGIVTNRFDNVPFDILLLVVLAAAAGSLFTADEAYFSLGIRTVAMAGFVCIVIAVFVLVPVYVNTISTRLKLGTLFKNTVIWRIIKLIWKFVCFICSKLVYAVKYLIRNMSLMWKYVLAFVGINIIELIVYIVSWNSTMDFGVVFFVLFKALVFVFFLKALVDMNKLKKAGVQLAGGNADYKVDTDKMYWEFKGHGNELNCIGDGIHKAVDERLKSERMKTELITNVSHDIKTPLTSIINYVDLLEKEDIQGEKAKEYIEVLDRQSNRLKKLIEDLIDASKASTGNVNVTLETVDAGIMLGQAIGEFQDRLDAKGLKVVESSKAKQTNVIADGKLLWRCLANVFSNLCKYSEENTRVYIDTENADDGRRLAITVKNISKDELNISGDELMERFVRGDSSRNTEGSGLGLSIAQSLMELMNGELKIVVDGDLFKVMLLLDVSAYH
jgi:signal transduction histidine kinase